MSQSTVKNPGFSMYLVAIFVPPLYFLMRKRFIAFIISLLLLFLAIPFLFVFGFGIFIWIGVALWAVFGLRGETTNAFIRQQATEIAKAIKEESVTS